jgi:23S rRNA (adenine2503-C2)-methyltransferase
MDTFMKKNVLDLSFSELKAAMLEFKFEKFRFTQLCDWIYKKHIFDFTKMTSFSKNLQAQLAETFTLFVPSIDDVVESKKDGSYKFLLKTHDGNLIESILMLAPGRATICVSCMIGCPLKCRFCATGSEVGFIRKLYAGEIVGQFLVVEKYAQEHKLADHITNVVFMGMGEQFLNLDSVGRAIATFTDENLFGLSKSKITVSTAGVGAGIDPTSASKSSAGRGLSMADFINKYGVNLAVSLHFPNDALRSEYMPINKTFPLEKLIAELKKINLAKRDYITIEYIMLAGINDKPEHARQLVKLLSSVKVKFNLIPYNPIGLFDAKPSSEKAINDFALLLKAKDFTVTVRRSHGVDIEGGCGQFALKKRSK